MINDIANFINSEDIFSSGILFQDIICYKISSGLENKDKYRSDLVSDILFGDYSLVHSLLFANEDNSEVYNPSDLKNYEYTQLTLPKRSFEDESITS